MISKSTCLFDLFIVIWCQIQTKTNMLINGSSMWYVESWYTRDQILFCTQIKTYRKFAQKTSRYLRFRVIYKSACFPVGISFIDKWRYLKVIGTRDIERQWYDRSLTIASYSYLQLWSLCDTIWLRSLNVPY